MGRLILALALLTASGTAAAPAPTALSVDVHARAFRQGEAMRVSVACPDACRNVTVRAFDTAWPATERTSSTWDALVGIDLDRRAGTYDIEVLATTEGGPLSGRRTVTVVPARFRQRRLAVAPKFVNPTRADQAQIDADRAFMATVYASRRQDASWTMGFVRPVPQVANSAFGTRSVFNGEARAPHAGTDFLSPAGTPVVAPAAGIVAAARPMFFTGNTVVIDHGTGVFSMLAHLSRIDVHEGETINPGDPVGLVGATGRVTGPHLHWALRIGDARVDALSALPLFDSGR